MSTLGVELIEGHFKTFEVEFAEDLNAEIIKIVEEKEIEKVYAPWIGDIHHDHQAVARSSLHSCRHVPLMLMYRSNWYHYLDFRGKFYVDISDYWTMKEKAILAHASEVERTRQKWVSFFLNEAENAGKKIGVKYAEVFDLVKWVDS